MAQQEWRGIIFKSSLLWVSLINSTLENILELVVEVQES